MRRFLISLFCLGLLLPARLAVAAEKQRSPYTQIASVARKLAVSLWLQGGRDGSGGKRRSGIVFPSWCQPCHTEFQHLRVAQAAYHKDVLRVVATNYFEHLSGFSDGGVPLNRFLENHTPWYSAVKGNDALAKRFANMTRIPTVFIFDRQGRLALHFIHRWKLARTNLTMEELHAALRPLLGFTPKIAPTSQSGY